MFNQAVAYSVFGELLRCSEPFYSKERDYFWDSLKVQVQHKLVSCGAFHRVLTNLDDPVPEETEGELEKKI